MDDRRADEPETASQEARLLTQLEEQWAKLAAAEALLAEQDQQLRAAAIERDRRREQAVRLARRARTGTTTPADDPHVHAELHEQAERLAGELHNREEEVERLRHEAGV